MYLWSTRCAANKAQFQTRILYPFFVPFSALPPLPCGTWTEHLAPLSASNKRQEEHVPGRCGAWRLSAASGALRPLSSARSSPARASAASRGPPRSPGSAQGIPATSCGARFATCFLPLTREKIRTPVPSRQVRKPQRKSEILRPRKSGPAHTLASWVLPLPWSQPPGHSPTGAWVGQVPFSSRGGLRKGSNSTSSSSAACSHLSGSVSGGGSRGRRTRTAQGNLLRTNSAPALAAETESFIIVRPTPPGDWPQGRARARLRRRRGWRQTTWGARRVRHRPRAGSRGGRALPRFQAASQRAARARAGHERPTRTAPC